MLGATLLPLCLRPKVLVVAEEAEESSEVGGWEVEIRLAIVTPDLGTTGVSEKWTLGQVMGRPLNLVSAHR